MERQKGIVKRVISGTIPRAHTQWMETVTLADAAIQNQLARLLISAENLTAANTMIADAEAARSEYGGSVLPEWPLHRCRKFHDSHKG